MPDPMTTNDTHRSPDGRLELRLTEGKLEARERDASRGHWSEWKPRTARSLLKDYHVNSPTWDWLRSHGIRRPAPSGPSGRSLTPEERRASGQYQIQAWVTEAVGRDLRALVQVYGTTVAALSAVISEAAARVRKK